MLANKFDLCLLFLTVCTKMYGEDTEIALQKIQEWIKAGNTAEDLKLCRLRLTSLPPLPNSVKSFWCSNTLITSLPEELPSSLERLFCFETCIKKLPKLPNTLTLLLCFNSPLIELPELPLSLLHLSCSKTQISILPELPLKLKTFNVSKCPNLLIQLENEETVESYEKRWKPIREKFQRERNVERCKTVKEELMAATWHPDRMIHWCWDEEEKKKWGSFESSSNAA